MRSLGRHLSYANVLSTLCLFLLLGGGAYAATQLPKNSVGTKQLKNGAVTAAKIKDGTITGAKVDSATLGTVPTATSAVSAGNAERATSAASADRAALAGKAEEATKADTAGNALLLEGNPASSFVSSSQVAYVDRELHNCSLSVICNETLFTLGGATVSAICENAAGPSGIILKVTGATRVGYSFVREESTARHGMFADSGTVIAAIGNSATSVGATGTIVIRTPSRIVSFDFDATTRIPSLNKAECTVAGTALAI